MHPSPYRQQTFTKGVLGHQEEGAAGSEVVGHPGQSSGEGSDTCVRQGGTHPPFKREFTLNFSDGHGGPIISSRDKLRRGLPKQEQQRHLFTLMTLLFF